MSYLLHPRQTNNKKGCCSSNTSGSVLDLRDLKQGGGWMEACGSQAPVLRWAVALKLCSSQKGKGGTRSTRPLSRNSGGISIQALDSGVLPPCLILRFLYFGLPRMQNMSHPSNLDFHGKQNYQWPGPGVIIRVSSDKESPGSAPGADGINSSGHTPQGFRTSPQEGSRQEPPREERERVGAGRAYGKEDGEKKKSLLTCNQGP